MTEPKITVNGTELSDAQAMAVRVAVSSFLMQLADPAERKALGPIAGLYEERLREVEGRMVPTPGKAWSEMSERERAEASAKGYVGGGRHEPGGYLDPHRGTKDD